MKKGFTLVELAIVLVIIGLLVGGVLAGQELINQAKINKVIAEFTSFDRAIKTFQTKYGALPGDYKRATNVWGTSAGNCLTTAGTGTATCNGDGDGQIDFAQIADNPREQHYAWNHLGNAELINGTYNGIYYTDCVFGSICERAGVNVPASNAIEGGIWSIFYVPQTLVGWAGRPVSRNMMQFGSVYNGPTYGGLRFGPILTPEQAYAIDLKMDDGIHNLGRVNHMSGGFAPGCTSGNNYVVATTTQVCTLLFDF